MSDERTHHRIVHTAPNCANVECGIDYTDGYRVTVGWSEDADEGYWFARCSGVSTGDVIATGVSTQDALLALACSLAATIDAVNAEAES